MLSHLKIKFKFPTCHLNFKPKTTSVELANLPLPALSHFLNLSTRDAVDHHCRHHHHRHRRHHHRRHHHRCHHHCCHHRHHHHCITVFSAQRVEVGDWPSALLPLRHVRMIFFGYVRMMMRMVQLILRITCNESDETAKTLTQIIS